jgi:hypothetical protein
MGEHARSGIQLMNQQQNQSMVTFQSQQSLPTDKPPIVHMLRRNDKQEKKPKKSGSRTPNKRTPLQTKPGSKLPELMQKR